MTEFVLYRKKISYKFKKDMKAPDSWDVGRNDQNNMLDTLILKDLHGIRWQTLVQSVANIPGGRHTDTVMPGKGGIKWDVDPRSYQCKVHGIVDMLDMDGQRIDMNSVEPVVGRNGAPIDLARWLVHDLQKVLPAPPMTLTRVAWSAGCFIGAPISMSNLYLVGTSLGIKKGEVIPLTVIEIE